MLEIKNLSFSYDTNEVLKNLNLSIADRSFHSLIGMSGAGKTLLLKLISGLQTLQSGTIEKTQQKISFVFQNAELFPWLTIEKNLQMCSSLRSVEIKDYLEKFRLDSVAKLYPCELSGGTLKKVALLRAFLVQSDLILMDEPFAYLDMAQKEEIYSFTKELWVQNKPTIIFVSHDLDEAIFLSTQISYLSRRHKTIVESYDIKNQSGFSFNESKTTPGHISTYAEIYGKLKEELI